MQTVMVLYIAFMFWCCYSLRSKRKLVSWIWCVL